MYTLTCTLSCLLKHLSTPTPRTLCFVDMYLSQKAFLGGGPSPLTPHHFSPSSLSLSFVVAHVHFLISHRHSLYLCCFNLSLSHLFMVLILLHLCGLIIQVLQTEEIHCIFIVTLIKVYSQCFTMEFTPCWSIGRMQRTIHFIIQNRKEKFDIKCIFG